MAFEAYWLTFRIEDKTTQKGTYGDRYDALINTLQQINDGWWAQPTSFIVFGSETARAAIIQRIKAALDTSVDMAVLGSHHVKRLELIGAATGFEALQSMVEFTKKV